VASNDRDLVALDLVCSGRQRLPGDHVVAPLTSHRLYVRRVEIECLGYLRMRSVQAQAVRAHNPDPQRWRRTSPHRVGSIVAVAATGLAQVALTRGLGVVTTVLGDLRAVTTGTTDPVWPA
jgi:hypothetical protein